MLPERLVKLRMQHDLSQPALAEDIGANKTNISEYENGITMPSSVRLFDLASYFKVSADWLLGLSDDRTIEEPCFNNFNDRFKVYYKEVKAKKGIRTLKYINSLTGIRQTTLQRWKQGGNDPYCRSLMKLSQGTGISVDWFIGLSNKRKKGDRRAKILPELRRKDG